MNATQKPNILNPADSVEQLSSSPTYAKEGNINRRRFIEASVVVGAAAPAFGFADMTVVEMQARMAKFTFTSRAEVFACAADDAGVKLAGLI